MIFVISGAAFIGSNSVIDCLAPGRIAVDEPVLIFDALTYAGKLANLTSVRGHRGLLFERQNICDGPEVLELLRKLDLQYGAGFGGRPDSRQAAHAAAAGMERKR